MSKTKQKLIYALLKHGHKKLQQVWGCSGAEVSRRLDETRNIPLADFCDALDAMGIALVIKSEEVCVTREELKALDMLASKYLELRTSESEANCSSKTE